MHFFSEAMLVPGYWMLDVKTPWFDSLRSRTHSQELHTPCIQASLISLFDGDNLTYPMDNTVKKGLMRFIQGFLRERGIPEQDPHCVPVAGDGSQRFFGVINYKT